jgi:hypothetical protein
MGASRILWLAKDDKSSAEHDKYATVRLHSIEKAQNLTSQLEKQPDSYRNTFNKGLMATVAGSGRCDQAHMMPVPAIWEARIVGVLFGTAGPP